MKLHDLFEDTHKIAYHGTNSTRANEILKLGFDLDKVGEKSNTKLSGVSTTINKEIAEEHAEWAVSKFGGKPVILKIDLSNLKIMPGSEVTKLWNKLHSLNAVLKIAKKAFDAVELFNFDEEVGEEFEILIFDPKKIKLKS